MDKPGYLSKILLAVTWGDTHEADFINILKKWTKVEPVDILFMLSFKFCVNDLYNKGEISQKMKEVRYFAVKSLQNISNKDISLILLQLVQALRYEELTPNSELRKFLIKRCRTDINLATSFYWFLNVESEQDLSQIQANFQSTANKTMLDFYSDTLEDFNQCINGNIKDQLETQIQIRKKLLDLALDLSKEKNYAETRKKKLLSKKSELSEFGQSYQLPINTGIQIKGIIPEKCIVFNSAKKPVKYTSKVTDESQKNVKDREDPSNYDFMFKYDDDLRKDQLILQIISYMDTFLQSVGMNMEFTTYKVCY